MQPILKIYIEKGRNKINYGKRMSWLLCCLVLYPLVHIYNKKEFAIEISNLLIYF